jgi:hypothetical protein
MLSFSVYFQKNDSGIQSSTELIRQLIDHGGVFDPETYQWREVQDVTYITTYNPQISTTVPKIGNRLLRHFSVFHIPYPRYDLARQSLRIHYLKQHLVYAWTIHIYVEFKSEL